MKTKRILLFCFMIVTTLSGIYSQSIMLTQGDPPTESYDPRVLAHYSVTELEEMRTLTPNDYIIFTYFLTQSYSIEHMDCFECTPVNLQTFDITRYEYLRKKDETMIYEDPKHGFKLTLYSMQSLPYRTPQQEYLLNH